MRKSIEEINEEYDLEIDRIIREIKKQNAKKVLLQFPDGLKPYSTAVADFLEKQLPKVEFFIWMGSCFGACDVPVLGEAEKDFDLLIQFGHTLFFRI